MNRKKAELANDALDDKINEFSFEFTTQKIESFFCQLDSILHSNYSKETLNLLSDYFLTINGFSKIANYEISENELQLQKYLSSFSKTEKCRFIVVCHENKRRLVVLNNYKGKLEIMYLRFEKNPETTDFIHDLLTNFSSNDKNKNYITRVFKLASEDYIDVMLVKSLQLVAQLFSTSIERSIEMITIADISDDDIKNYQEMLYLEIRSIYIQNILKSISSLQHKPDIMSFISEINFFLHQCHDLQSLSAVAESYALECAKYTRDEDDSEMECFQQMKEARNKFLNDPKIIKLIEESTQKMESNESYNETTLLPNVFQKFPEYMEILVTTIKLLSKCKDCNVKKDITKSLMVVLQIKEEYVELLVGKIANESLLIEDIPEETQHDEINYPNEDKNERSTLNNETRSSNSDFAFPNMQESSVNTDIILPNKSSITDSKDSSIMQDIGVIKDEVDKDHYNDVTIKSLEEIIAEFQISIKCNKAELLNSNDKAIIRQKVQKIKELNTVWTNKSDYDIKKWVKKNLSKDTDLEEMIAILDRANEIITKGQKLRLPQILALLFMLESSLPNINVSQVQTGEGKTTLIALLAIIKIWTGCSNVDIITSNSVLAEEGLNSKEKLYEMCNITVATNNGDNTYRSGPRECYDAKVVYGTMSMFQFDHLRHTFEALNTKGLRQFSYLILDEVDSMLIDNANYLAKLSSQFPGMDFLRYIYIKIWQELYKAQCFIEKKFQGELHEQIGKLSTEYKSGEIGIEELQEEIVNLEQHLHKLPYDSLFKIVYESINLDHFTFLPQHVLSYAKSTLKKWIKNAIYAKFSCHENEMYVVQEGGDGRIITPVDSVNTGMTLKNTVWNSGLHQFLQIKHNIRITSETLTSSCISNIAYVQKYGNNIFGVSGTLGSHAEQVFLSTVYNVNLAFVPTFKTKRFSEQDCKVVPDDEWCHSVASDAILKVDQGRAVLIICKTIVDAESIQCYLENFMCNNTFGIEINIRTYKDESFSAVTSEEVSCGTIIIATNIAGRGADFKTSTILEAHGGLHVCVSYLPGNERVKEQAYYRTSRQGMQGSAQMVIRFSEARTLEIHEREVNFLRADDIRKKMEENEMAHIDFLLHTKLNEIKILDALFEKFSDLYSQQDQKYDFNNEYQHYLLDLKERWAFWLEKQNMDGRKYSESEVENLFKKFLDDEDTCKDGTIDFNPYYSIQQAEYYIENNKLDKALDSLTRATKICNNSNVLSAVPLKQFEIALEKNPALYNRIVKAMKKIISLGIYEGDQNKVQVEKLLGLLKSSKNSLLLEIDYIKENFFEENVKESNDFQNILIINQIDKVNEMTRQIETRYICLQKQFQHLESLCEQFGIADNSKGYTISAKVKLNHKEVSDMVSKTSDSNESETSNNTIKKENISVQSGDNNLAHAVSGALEQNISRVTTHITTSFSSEVSPVLSSQTKDKISLPVNYSIVPDIFPNTCLKLEQNGSIKEKKTLPASQEIEELEATGLSFCYAVNEVNDVPSELIKSSLGLIASGVALLLAGIAFPPIFVVNCAIANVLITEGIVDLVIEFIKRNSEGFNAKEYIKGKVISFSVSAITFGITAILTCQKILQKAINVCKRMHSALKNCRKFKYIVEKLTTLLEYIISCLDKMKKAAIFASNTNKLRFNNISRLNIFKQAMCTIGRDALKSVVCAVVMEKVVTNCSRIFFSQFQENVSEMVEKNLSKNLNKEKIRQVKKEEIIKICKDMLFGIEKCDILDATEKVSIGVVKQFGNKINCLLPIVCESVLSFYKSVEFSDAFGSFSQNLNDKLASLNGNEGNDEKQIIKEMSQIIANAICTRMENTSNSWASCGINAATSALVNKVIPINDVLYVDGKPITDDAHAFLEIDKNATDEDFLHAYLTKCDELKKQNNKNSDLLLDRLQLAMQSCDKLYLIDKSNSNCVFQSFAQILNVNESDISGATGLVALPEGVSIQDATKILKNLNLKTCKRTFDTCDEKVVADYLQYQNSDHATFFVKGVENELGHAVTVELEGNKVYVHDMIDGNKVKMTWSEYANQADVTCGTILTAKNLNDKRKTAQEYVNKNKNLYSDDEKRAGENSFQNRYGKGQRKEGYITIIRDGEFYQEEKLKFAVGGKKQKDSMKKIFSELNKYVDEVNETADRNQRKKREHSNTTAIFGINHDNPKTQMMFGIFDVTLSNGEKLKFITNSGESPLAVRQKWETNKDTGYPKATEAVPLKLTVDGYNFIPQANPKGKNIVNLYSGETTDKKHTSSCAAQKAVYYVGERLKEYKQKGQVVNVKNMEMREQWFAPRGVKNSEVYTKYDAAMSCSKCKHDLPYSAGKESD